MPSLQTSGPISLQNVKTVFGGPTSPAMNNYYRGGTYLPSSVTTSALVYEPAGGGFIWVRYDYYFWVLDYDVGVIWNGAFVGTNPGYANTTATIGIYTYYKGAQSPVSGRFYIRRTYTGTTTTSVNASVPSSGQISMSQFYGATTGT
jgi:hypothetical protein